MFLIGPNRHHHPAVLLQLHTLILDRLLTFLVAFSTLVLKPLFSGTRSIHSYLSPPRANLSKFHHLFRQSLVAQYWQMLQIKLAFGCAL